MDIAIERESAGSERVMSAAVEARQSAYDRKFFEAQSPGSLRSARKVVPVVLSLVPVRSVVDVGCGVGTWLSVFRECGVQDLLGIDGGYVDQDTLLIPRDRFVARDLETPLELQRRFDLAISLEVAEHLPEARARSFVDELVALADRVLFSAAIPNQGGNQHINEQWQSYWRDLFLARGYRPVDCIRHRFWQEPTVASYYQQNMILYVEEDLLARTPDLQLEAQRGAVIPCDLVHPLLFEQAVRQPGLRRLLHALPGAIRQTIKWRLGI